MNVTSASISVSSRGGSYAIGEPTPRDPSILASASELISHIGQLEHELGILRSNLLSGGQIGEAAPECGTSIEAMVSAACTRVACMVGDMATINAKVAQ